MNRLFLLFFVPAWVIISGCSQHTTVNGVHIAAKGKTVMLQNDFVQVVFNLQTGYYQVYDLAENVLCIDSAYAEVNDLKTTDKGVVKWNATPDSAGQSLLIEHQNEQKIKLLLRFSLQKDNPRILLTAGLENASSDTLIIKHFSPLSGGKLFKDRNITENMKALTGTGGAVPTEILDSLPVHSINNLLLYFGNKTSHRSVVLGGITYSEFNKYVRLDHSVELYAKDPVGKRLDPNSSYLPDGDRFYVDCITQDPFIAIETYGKALSDLQNAHPQYYYFPSICLWYAMKPVYGKSIATNDSPGAVAEMQRVKDSGWLRYTTMAIRLVPDCYDENNENGWWDDVHWQQHGSGRSQQDIELKGGHLRKPYETTRKWAQAVTELGGIPLIYFQTAVRSKDYAEQFPEHMLFNESFHALNKDSIPEGITQGEWGWAWGNLNQYCTSYDFTDKDFVAHIRDVYKNLNDGGVRGLMYDYPSTGWAFYGGMDDRYATAGSMYRTIFQLARDGLGADAFLHERNFCIGSDITLGIVSSQRIWTDTDIATPEMITRGGLRWYKNRVAVGYDMDAKNLLKASPSNDDGLHKLLTMSYTAGSRLLLANSFSSLDRKHIFALSRIFPYHSSTLTARPVDMLQNAYPKVYSFHISDDWLQVVFYNQDDNHPATISAEMSAPSATGGLELQSDRSYYVYDFWNNLFVGKISGNAALTQDLRPGEARMLSIRAVAPHPQVVSTDRHLLQGYIELSDIAWDESAKTLKGNAQLIENEPITITIATNGYSGVNTSSEVTASMKEQDGLLNIVLQSDKGGWTAWKVDFSN
ncbi:MAG: hypothetical protein LBR49_06345 [Tannerella sp.]|jgi:hypothetical protein|nr:hypothetical protein [Tannerella sp.]